MREKGIVTKLTGDTAIVMVERLENTGCGCGNCVRKNTTLIEARNNCNARLNDRVYLESDFDWAKYRGTVRTAVSFGMLILGMTAGNVLFPRLGPAAVPCSVALGFILAAAAFWGITKIFKRKPLGRPEVVALI
ncbi:MAG: SoxR reducing system RseC family protein [Spirochaetaceae bacterium]|jgi:hypothetical protein|nr:SoxR reducing system RseC family protein [Spirochaetaceae bacterium]